MAEMNRDAAAAIPPTGLAPAQKALYCSFCSKSQHEVKTLISGSAGIVICSECVDLCNAIIAGRLPKSLHPSLDAIPTERLLERLAAIEETVQGRGNQLQRLVDHLRGRQVSWARIGAALGISRQSAWERFT
jgi:ATP-dependent Clp protease ATP-binding subunit ClpX